jgi:hypothetical protein
MPDPSLSSAAARRGLFQAAAAACVALLVLAFIAAPRFDRTTNPPSIDRIDDP